MIDDQAYDLVYCRNPGTVTEFFNVLQMMKDRKEGIEASFNTTFFFPPATTTPQQVLVLWPSSNTPLAYRADDFGFSNPNPSTRAATTSNNSDPMNELLQGIRTMTAHLMQVTGQNNQKRPNQPYRSQRPIQAYNTQRACYNCNQFGHHYRDCPQTRNFQNNRGQYQQNQNYNQNSQRPYNNFQDNQRMNNNNQTTRRQTNINMLDFWEDDSDEEPQYNHWYAEKEEYSRDFMPAERVKFTGPRQLASESPREQRLRRRTDI
jgi:hypothetical protein